MITMMTRTRLAAIWLLVLAATLAVPAPAQAQTNPRDMSPEQVSEALRGNESIWSTLQLAATIYFITQECDTLQGQARVIYTMELLALYNQARRMGFTRAQIQHFVDDPEEQADMEVYVRRMLQARGVDPDVPQQVCAFGRSEMAARTEIGRRLREER